MKSVILHDKKFRVFIPHKEIQKQVRRIASELNNDYHNKTPLMIAVLNGSFMFASDLMKELTIACELSFVKLSSYQGVQSSGTILKMIGLSEEVRKREIIILEDIIDTGNTLHFLLEELKSLTPASVRVCTLLLKPAALKQAIHPAYTGFEIPNEFVVGYGLDYEELGRNLKDIYKLAD